MTKRYLAQQGIGYFAFAFLFLRSFSVASHGGRPLFTLERMPNGIPFPTVGLPADIYLTFSIVSVALSMSFGIAFFFPLFRKPSLRAESLFSLVFSPAAFLSFLATWFDNQDLLGGVAGPWGQVFTYAFLFWLAFLMVSFIVDLRKLRKKL